MSDLPLFDFQKEDVEHLRDQRGALIANEMGSGKTYEAIQRDLDIRKGPWNRDPVTLVVAPLTTLQDVWQEHYEKLTDIPVTVIKPKAREGSYMDFLHDGGVLCVHWEVLRRMPELGQTSWTHIIADECHRMKDRKAQQSRALKSIRTVWKTAMSGTPAVNRPDELWSVLNWLYPERYRSYWKFFNNYVDWTYIEARGRRFRKILGPTNVKQLHREIGPFYVRRLKKDVLKDLPDKYYTVIKVDLSVEQRRIYKQMRDDMMAWIGDQEEELLAAPVVVAQLTRLQQFAVAYASLDANGRVRLSEPSSKLDALMEVLDEAGPDKQVVVFSRFRQLIDLAARRFQDKSIPYVTLTGSVAPDDRRTNVARFQQGDARVFAGTIAAGGVGINLHAASVAVFLDRDWSPALNSQAEDRLHRFGQKNAVQIIDIIARNTVDRGRDQALQLKKEWIEELLGDKPKGGD